MIGSIMMSFGDHGGRDVNRVQREEVRPRDLGWDQGRGDQEYRNRGDRMPLKLKNYETLEAAFHEASKVEEDLKEEKSYKAKSSLTSTWDKGKCQERGHVASESPNRRTIVALRDGYKIEDEDEGEEKMRERELGVKERKVLRRMKKKGWMRG
ncbi:hypothetical protein H5410_003871 [Solanum commersonii]|uniref:Uncharacterized protein n=1 Tax=Solanum commersonii TaxID=4109 RepID=A0A9J6B6C7_SOLCO|nr:hypothetical protein H5410_003871 [Solanum commersonii]